MKRIAFSLLILPLAACATIPPGGTSREDLPAARHELISSIQKRNSGLWALRGLATVRFGSRVVGARGETAILVKAPFQLRVDGLAEFGLSQSQLVASHGDLFIYWGQKNRYLKGLATRERLAHYLRVSLDPESLIQLVLGVIPLEPEENYRLKRRREGEWVLRGGSGELVVDQKAGETVPLRFTATDLGGGRRYMVTYGDYRDEGGFLFPHRLTARFWDPGSRLEIQYHDVEINPSLDAGLFKLKIPEDAKPVEEDR